VVVQELVKFIDDPANMPSFNQHLATESEMVWFKNSDFDYPVWNGDPIMSP
jgi:hypothetical protein